jgi:DNA-binding transcriptional LysR family regulator
LSGEPFLRQNRPPPSRELPVEPADLELYDCVMLNARNNESDWDLVDGRKKARIHVSGPISSRDFNSVSTFVYRGHGIGLLPSTYCDEALASGALIRLLPKWASPQIPVFAVYSNRKFEVESPPGGAGSLEESAVAQEMRGSASHSA